MYDVSSAPGDICLCLSSCAKLAESHPTPNTPFSPKSTLPPQIWLYSPLKSLPLGHKCLSEGRTLGASAEGGATHGDLGLATGDGGRAQRCWALPTRDGGFSKHVLGLLSSDRCVPQVEGRLALCDAGVTHGGGEDPGGPLQRPA